MNSMVTYSVQVCGYKSFVRFRGDDSMVTYSDLIQFCIFIVALVGLCYKIFKDKRK